MATGPLFNWGLSRFRGVVWNKPRNKWQALMQVNRRRVTLGCYATEEDAARVRDIAAVHLGVG